MKRGLLVVPLAVSILFGAGCHASRDDAAGQAGELADPVRRENAVANITRLHSLALERARGDRNNAGVKAVVDATIEKLVQTYVEHPEDVQNGQHIINVLYEMRDVRGLPALTKAFDWRQEVNEEHAIRAAETVRSMSVPEAQKGPVIEALHQALEKVTGARPADNRMRIGFIRALGSLRDRRTTPVLTKIATAQVEAQSFLINRLAAHELGQLGDPATVPAMIQCLFLFAPNNPAMRMNDVAAEALVQIGRPAYEPLLAVLRGQDQAANAIAQQYIEAVRQRDERAASQMNLRTITSGEATFTLGALGFRDALEPLVAEAGTENIDRRISGAIALVRLNLEPADLPRVRGVLEGVYSSAPLQAKPQLLVAIQHLYDGEALPFLLAEARDGDLHPDVRVQAVNGYGLLATRSEAGELRSLIEREPRSEDGGYRENFAAIAPALDAAAACDRDVACWIGKLADRDNIVVRKAATMLGRFGRGNARAIEALVERFGHMDLEVRLSALSALDHIAVSGSAAAVAKIEHLHETEDGQSIWSHFSREALTVQARLRIRAAR